CRSGCTPASCARWGGSGAPSPRWAPWGCSSPWPPSACPASATSWENSWSWPAPGPSIRSSPCSRRSGWCRRRSTPSGSCSGSSTGRDGERGRGASSDRAGRPRRGDPLAGALPTAGPRPRHRRARASAPLREPESAVSHPELVVLSPLLLVALAAVADLVLISFWRSERAAAIVAFVGLLLAFAALPVAASYVPRSASSLLVVDRYALFFIGLILVAGMTTVVLSYGYLRESGSGELYVLFLLATMGAAVLA